MVAIRRHKCLSQRKGQRNKTTTSISAFFGDNSSHQIKQKHSSAKSSCCARCARRSAQNVFLRRESLSRRKRKKETLNILLLLHKTRIRNVRRTSKHFPTTKVDFLMINVVLRIIRTESERLAYGSRLICNFLFSG